MFLNFLIYKVEMILFTSQIVMWISETKGKVKVLAPADDNNDKYDNVI